MLFCYADDNEEDGENRIVWNCCKTFEILIFEYYFATKATIISKHSICYIDWKTSFIWFGKIGLTDKVPACPKDHRCRISSSCKSCTISHISQSGHPGGVDLVKSQFFASVFSIASGLPLPCFDCFNCFVYWFCIMLIFLFLWIWMMKTFEVQTSPIVSWKLLGIGRYWVGEFSLFLHHYR